MRKRSLEITAVTAIVSVIILGAWVLIGKQEDVGVDRASAGQAKQTMQVKQTNQTMQTEKQAEAVARKPITEPLKVLQHNESPSVPASTVPADLHPTSVTITRGGKLQDVKAKPPQTYAVSEASLAARLYKTLLTLDFVPNPDGYFCPADVGISYDLQFADDHQHAFHVTANASGCRFVRLDDGTAFWESDSFQQAMMDATGMNKDQLWGLPGSF
ncbi:hypothetical protein GZH47_19915 [Paenibacillus rhizovicinus]|uniref:Uncharacterized protein n=1 Tax=Paenibacillus rhizovicinus TaxID=2704463 RepID=A0A6C0P4U7_9BACL|nr:hypothetical protein [Paenibacillus rhizovicinus]QHW32853.1 hypothetical protein GZH47_19915 [Paenibacillus rhizovicinus]